MLHRVTTTDPMTGRDLHDVSGRPCVVHAGAQEELVIYFESEASKRAYLQVPVQHPIEHRLNLDNPTDVMIDEG